MSLMLAGPWREFTDHQSWQAITVNMAYVVRVCLRDNGQESSRPWASLVFASGEVVDVEIPIGIGQERRAAVDKFMAWGVK